MGDLVSIIIPTYIGYDMLPRAIDSALRQTYENIEILVVDDNDPDSEPRRLTAELMKNYSDSRIRYIRRPKNSGIAAAKNTGIENASGVYLAFLDDDDYYLKDRIEKCVRYMEKHESYIGVYTGVDILDRQNNVTHRLRPKSNMSVNKMLMNHMALGTGSNTFIRREYAEKIGRHDESFIRRTDNEFTVRLCKCGTIGYINECLVVKGINSTDNIPSYETMKGVLDHFFEVFAEDINKLGYRKTEFYRRQYHTLMRVAIRDKNRNEIKEAYRLIRRYGRVNLKTRIRMWIFLHNLTHVEMLYIWIVSTFKPRRF